MLMYLEDVKIELLQSKLIEINNVIQNWQLVATDWLRSGQTALSGGQIT